MCRLSGLRWGLSRTNKQKTEFRFKSETSKQEGNIQIFFIVHQQILLGFYAFYPNIVCIYLTHCFCIVWRILHTRVERYDNTVHGVHKGKKMLGTTRMSHMSRMSGRFHICTTQQQIQLPTTELP